MPSITPIDVADLAAALVDFLHGLHHLADHFATLNGHATGIGRQLAGLARVVGVLLSGRAHFFHGRGGFLQRRGLLLGARRKVAVALRDLHTGRGHAVRPLPDVADHACEGCLHLAHGGQQRGEFVAGVVDHRDREIAIAHPLCHLLGHLHPAAQQLCDKPGKGHQRHGNHHRDRGQHQRGGLGALFNDGNVGFQPRLLDFTPFGEQFQQRVAGRYGLVHQVGEGLVLLAFIDQRDVGLAVFPEGGHRGRKLDEMGLAFRRKQALLERRQHLVHVLVLVADVAQRVVELLRIARQDGVPDLERNLGDVELQFGHGLQLRHPVGLGVFGLSGRVVETEMRVERQCDQSSSDQPADEVQALGDTEAKTLVHDGLKR
jgi:hypothetical protein